MVHQINALSVKEMAKFCRHAGIPLVHFSTDYVYSGRTQENTPEDEAPDPLNTYGKSKAEADRLIQESGCRHLILRVSAVFNETGRNFLLSVIDQARAGKSVRVVGDQWVRPSYARDIAAYSVRVIDQFLRQSTESDVVHVLNGGEASWFEFAEAAFKKAVEFNLLDSAPKIEPVSTEKLGLAAKRPHRSLLSLEKLKNRYGVVPRHWTEALEECLDRLKHESC